MQDILQGVGEDVGAMMKDFSVEYVKALISSKLEGAMDDAVATVFPSADEGGDDDGGDEKGGDDEKEAPKPVAAGVAMRGYKIAVGPDRMAHRYYDMACFALKPEGSVICKVVRKHGQLTNFTKSFGKQCGDLPKDAAWPKKKMMGKNNQYYRDRYTGMDDYFKKITEVDSVSTHPDFLKYFELEEDEDRAGRLEIFMAAIESLCDNNGINFGNAQKTAERLGFDVDECEMLKVVAVEKVGKEAVRKLRVEVNSTVPGAAPAKVKNKFVRQAEGKLAGVIAKAVETAWTAAKEAFAKIVEKLNEILDKGMDPIKELFSKALTPIGDVVKDKLGKAEAKLEVDDGLDKKLNIARFPPLKACLEAISGGGKADDEIKKLIESVGKMSDCYQFAGYLMYNLGDPEIGQYIPFLNEIQDSHYRLAVSMTDMCYLLSRAATRAFRPLASYVDFCGDSYDAKQFESGLAKALRECGRSLASDYFDMPYQTRRMTWRLPSSVTSQLLDVAQTTICMIGDLLGKIGANWKPTSKDDAKATFVKTFGGPLDDFIADRTKLWTTVIRRGTEAVIADQLMSVVGEAIDKIAEGLNDLCSALPDPLGENLKAGDIVKYLLNKMAENAVIKVVQMVASKTEGTLYDCTKFADDADKDVVYRLRYRPYIRPDNYDPADPAEDSGGDDDDDKDKDKDKDEKKDDDGDKPAMEKQMTNDNTPDSDDEGADGAAK